MTDKFSEELALILKDYQGALVKSQHDDASDVLNLLEVVSLQTERVTGRRSIYYGRAVATDELKKHEMKIGVVDSLL